MKRHITEICNKDLKKGVFTNAQFIFIAESCAMGEAGKVMILTSGGSIFQGNYCFGDIKLSKLYCVVPVLKDCVFDPFGDDRKTPEGWEYEYLGSGNHLIVREDIYTDFKAGLKDAKYPEDIYPIWFDVAWNIIEKQNREKSPLSTKTHEELLLLMNKEMQYSETMTEEEQIEYDSEYGYDSEEDFSDEEICCEKIKTTQTYKEFVKQVQQEYENKGNVKVQFEPCPVWKSGDQINLWTYWQGYQIEKVEKGIDILLVGQDWGNPNRELDVVERIKQFQKNGGCVNYSSSTNNPTDKMLIKLFAEIGYDITKENPGCRLFFTNYSLGYRTGSETGGMTKTLLRKDKEYFEALVKILKPKIIICLGKLVYEVVTDKTVSNFVKQLRKGALLMATYPSDDKITVFGVPHCGSRGANNIDGYEKMKQIWKEMKNLNFGEVSNGKTR